MAKGTDSVGKLVRDKIPAIIAASGLTATVSTLDYTAYAAALLDKLDEEAAELRSATNNAAAMDEAADVLEVLIGIAELRGHTVDDLLQVAANKRAERGSFRNKLWLHDPVEVPIATPQQPTLVTARCYTRAEILSRPCPIPKSPGVYGWWFHTVPGPVDTSNCQHRDGMTLLYNGISPARPPTNGKPPSSQTLQHRIRYHYTGNAEGSTLRKTLGVLLAEELGIELRRVGSGTRRTFGIKGEAALSSWMAGNALVSWVVRPEPWLLEAELIATLDVPLNLQGNAHNPFYAILTQLRSNAERNARTLPVI